MNQRSAETVIPPVRATTATAGATLRRKQGFQHGGWFVAPFLLLFTLFVIWPLLRGVYLSFTDANISGEGASFVGLDNYREALGDSAMWDALGHSGCQSAQLFTAEDVPEGNDQPLLIMGLKGWRDAREVDLLLSTRFDQPHAWIAAMQRTTNLVLELVDRLPGIPGRCPDIRDQGGRKPLTLIALHGKRQRRIRVLRRPGLVDVVMGAHGGAPTVTMRLPGDPHARHPKSR